MMNWMVEFSRDSRLVFLIYASFYRDSIIQTPILNYYVNWIMFTFKGFFSFK